MLTHAISICIIGALTFPSDARRTMKEQVFPTRTNDDSALLEWGHSAVIHAADAVVARFGLQTAEEEFELGIEAAPVFGKPTQGCEPLRNAEEIGSQMVFLFRGSCDFATKARHAAEAGAVAVVIVNHDHTHPDHAFAMAKPTTPEETLDETSRDAGSLSAEELVWSSGTGADWANPPIPCVMVSWNSGQAILEDRPERLRLYPGGGRPFIESVSDDSPVVFIIHNLLTDEECAFLKEVARGRLRSSRDEDEDVRMSRGNGGKVALAKRRFNTTVLRKGALKSPMHKAIDEKLFSIINFPPEYYADLQINEFIEGGMHGPHYDSDRYPSLYRERVMTVVYCLDSIPEGAGGDFMFPKANLRVRQQAGMAIVYHNTIEDGSLDAKSAHADEELLNGTKWTATQRIYARPIPLAGRTIIPAFISLLGGETPNWMFRYRDWAMEKFGDDTGFEAFNYSFFAFVAIGLIPVFLLVIHLLRKTQDKAPQAAKVKTK
mmetsp:Transcript_39489/g.79742  ORF Transcript_39489/g.79742 Transcript_39489/m.79742 type:complete len:491 (-) Transcript_39489:3-1475(-)